MGEWPLRDYVSTHMLDALGARHSSWENTTRGQIHFVEPDDDVNYTILGMLLLEQHGINLTKANIRDAWIHHLTVGTTWGPERTMLARASVNHLAEGSDEFEEPSQWADFLNPNNEFCGAQIRADAYGYACPGRPELAAELAWRDASWTHRKTGTYSTMWTAAAIAVAPVAKTPLEIFEVANMFVPQKSRFYQAVSFALEEVRKSSDWMDGYNRLHAKLGQHGHCRVYFESATLINTLQHAKNISDGFCIQVMQGNDTDSYGATSGSILGAYFGPGNLESRWLQPFNDDIHTALCWFYERSLSKLAKRMGELPARISKELETA
jgi:ADP-ribosylglycohydrolase